MTYSDYRPIELEKMALGEASVRVLKTRDGTLSYKHYEGESLKWDDLPQWDWKDAWIISVQAQGLMDWEYKTRRNAKKVHRGTGEITILNSQIFHSELSAENYALEQALRLEGKGFKTRMKFENPLVYEGRDLSQRISWHNNWPKSRRVWIDIEKIKLNQEDENADRNRRGE